MAALLEAMPVLVNSSTARDWGVVNDKSVLRVLLERLSTFWYVAIPYDAEAQQASKDIIGLAIPIFVLLIALEWLYGKLIMQRDLYTINDTLGSFFSGITQQWLSAVFKMISLPLYLTLYNDYRLTRDLCGGGTVALWSFTACAVEFKYYWFHRWSHEFQLLWASHSVHHSGEQYNLATALRQGAMQTLASFLLTSLPLALLGVPPKTYALHSAMNTVSQFVSAARRRAQPVIHSLTSLEGPMPMGIRMHMAKGGHPHMDFLLWALARPQPPHSSSMAVATPADPPLPSRHLLTHRCRRRLTQWFHTEAIHKLPSCLEFVLNTPSHHRRHHLYPGNCNCACLLTYPLRATTSTLAIATENLPTLNPQPSTPPPNLRMPPSNLSNPPPLPTGCWTGLEPIDSTRIWLDYTWLDFTFPQTEAFSSSSIVSSALSRQNPTASGPPLHRPPLHRPHLHRPRLHRPRLHRPHLRRRESAAERCRGGRGRGR